MLYEVDFILQLLGWSGNMILSERYRINSSLSLAYESLPLNKLMKSIPTDFIARVDTRISDSMEKLMYLFGYFLLF